MTTNTSANVSFPLSESNGGTGNTSNASNPSISKAWVQFTVSAGVVTVNASLNVTSVTRNGAGDYTINFTTAFSSANYSFSVTAGQGAAGTNAYLVSAPGAANPTASAFRFETKTILFANADANFISATFFGAQ